MQRNPNSNPNPMMQGAMTPRQQASYAGRGGPTTIINGNSVSSFGFGQNNVRGSTSGVTNPFLTGTNQGGSYAGLRGTLDAGGGYSGNSGSGSGNIGNAGQTLTRLGNDANNANLNTQAELLNNSNELRTRQLDQLKSGYSDLLSKSGSGYADLYNLSDQNKAEQLAAVAKIGGPAREREAQQTARQTATANQQLIGRGLGNSTVVQSVDRGIADDSALRNRELDSADAARQLGVYQNTNGQRIQLGQQGLQSQLGLGQSGLTAQNDLYGGAVTERLGIIGARKDVGPNLGQYSQLASQPGAQGGGYDGRYSPTASTQSGTAGSYAGFQPDPNTVAANNRIFQQQGVTDGLNAGMYNPSNLMSEVGGGGPSPNASSGYGGLINQENGNATDGISIVGKQSGRTYIFANGQWFYQAPGGARVPLDSPPSREELGQ